jgi:hypothetical protein
MLLTSVNSYICCVKPWTTFPGRNRRYPELRKCCSRDSREPDRGSVRIWGGLDTPKAVFTTYIPIAMVLSLAMYLDAAYSGDWSRIGVLTKQQEKFLQDFSVFVVLIHAFLGLAATQLSRKGDEK